MIFSDGPAAAAWAKLRERAPAAAELLATGSAALRASAPAVLAASDFVLDALSRDTGLLAHWLADGGAQGGESLAAPRIEDVTAVDAQLRFMSALRRWRTRELVRIAWRDLAGWAPLHETLRDLSETADRALRAAYECARSVLVLRHGVPRSAAGEEQQLIIVAMGKLGGGELNFSSDIDLIFLYSQSGETDGERQITNEEFFTRLGQLLIRLLDQRTEDGFAFRVDMRLRPFGDSGPLVASTAALEDYLQIHGRDWERYAWVKARAVTGVDAYAQLFRNAVRPFVYRRYLDYGVFESLREMKALIEREVARRDLADHIKLGDGGIREIEFIVQAFQLIRGGQDRRLQTASLLQALPLLEGAKLLPPAAVEELEEAYIFLRRLENRLQMRADRQTHRLPEDAEERACIAASMGFDDWRALTAALDTQRARVSAHFRAIVFGERGALPPAEAAALGNLWEAEQSAATLSATFSQLGYDDCGAAAQLLIDVGNSSLLRRLDGGARQRLTTLVPVLIHEAARTRQPLDTLRRLLRIVEAIGLRSSYFSLLLHNARARLRLVELAAHGDFLSNQVAAHPLLLDELIDETIFEQLPDRAALQADLDERMAGVDEGDDERLLEQLRHFQRAAIFRIAVVELFGGVTVMRVSDRLTDVAELIVERALTLVWQQLTPQLGVPMCGAGAARRPARICAVGYGKLGGMELGYSSDLDLVFLHDSSGERQETQGAGALDNQVFFLRFAQRLVHLLTVHSPAGRLYDVDMRLRPSGKGGMLITNIDSFAEYQRREAWTWEHQALLHARAVAGAAELRVQFEALRLAVLEQNVRRDSLRDDVRKMRNRMRNELSHAAKDEFDLKQDPGGIADIEFLAQYWALKWAAEYPPVALFADTIRQLESVASADLVGQATIDVLTHAYRAYRAYLHRRALDGLSAVIPGTEFTAERLAVVKLWNQTMD